MYTTVKMSVATKRRLEQFKARVERVLGRDLTQAELIDEMAKFLSTDPAAFAARIKRRGRPFGPKEFEKVKNAAFSWGVTTRPEDIDFYLYGWRRE